MEAEPGLLDKSDGVKTVNLNYLNGAGGEAWRRPESEYQHLDARSFCLYATKIWSEWVKKENAEARYTEAEEAEVKETERVAKNMKDVTLNICSTMTS